MKEKKQKKAGQKRLLWRGLTTVTASVLTLSVTATTVVGAYRTDIDKFLGTQSSEIVTGKDASADELYTYKSDYSSTKELLTSISDLGERMSEEGSVLLKNNGALPLSKAETQKLTLLGFNSYYPIQGGDMGSSLAVNKGTDADTVDMVGAFTAKGFQINQTVQKMYESLKETYKSTTVLPWMSVDYYHATTPGIGATYTNMEPTQAALDGASSGWKDTMQDQNVMLVTIGRSGGENADYQVGESGVTDKGLHETDALGLSDSERDLIKAATDAKKTNHGKVVILLNNTNPMEIQELVNNADIDAILQIGMPGGYGFYGVADLLDGDANPSGHLTDTYAVKNASAPASQNYGDYEYTNADPDQTINSEIVQAEDIYTGYKYYETRYADSVMGQGNAASAAGSSTSGNWNYASEVTFPFGYGLSYTTFTQTLDDVKVDLAGKSVTAKVTVQNTGKVAGKDVAQLYVSVPYTDYDKTNGVEKSALQLIGYEKTKQLEPGESETLTITADAEDMASWDSTFANAAGSKGAYILDAGTYSFSIGNGAHEAMNNILASEGKTTTDGMTAQGNAENVKQWSLDAMDTTTFATSDNGTVLQNQMDDADLNYYMPGTVTYLSRSDWSATWPKTYKDLTANDKMLSAMKDGSYTITAQGDPSSVTFGAKNNMTLAQLKGVTDITDPRWSKLMDQITLEECMIRTAFGGTSTKTIESLVSPEAVQNDGPNGFNSYTLGQYANTDTSSKDPYAIDPKDKNLNYKFGTMANEATIAQTFNKELATEFGKVLGNYSIWANCAILWGIGINIHRAAYNGRNFEYYSEDPVLAGEMGAASILAAKTYGLILAPKHVAFNSMETNRTGVCTFLNEQTAREGELRTLQKCVEKAGALGIMTAFNRVGCVAANADYNLLMNIVRGEWGFKGLASEDFIQDANYAFLEDAVHCGVTMTCNTGTSTMQAVQSKWDFWTIKNVGQDATMMQDLKNCMLWQNYALANSNAMDGLDASSAIVKVRTWYDNALLAAIIVFALLTLGSAYQYSRAARKAKEEE